MMPAKEAALMSHGVTSTTAAGFLECGMHCPRRDCRHTVELRFPGWPKCLKHHNVGGAVMGVQEIGEVGSRSFIRDELSKEFPGPSLALSV